MQLLCGQKLRKRPQAFVALDASVVINRLADMVSFLPASGLSPLRCRKATISELARNLASANFLASNSSRDQVRLFITTSAQVLLEPDNQALEVPEDVSAKATIRASPLAFRSYQRMPAASMVALGNERIKNRKPPGSLVPPLRPKVAKITRLLQQCRPCRRHERRSGRQRCQLR